MYTYHLRNID